MLHGLQMLHMSGVFMQPQQSLLSLPVHSLAAFSQHSMRAPAGPLERSGLRRAQHTRHVSKYWLLAVHPEQVQVPLLPVGVLLRQADLIHRTW